MIVSTKLYIPHVRNSLVCRPRLMSKLDEGRSAKLTLVSAHAGYGKTTALSEWAKQCSEPVAWVSLDNQDNDWIRFWSYMTTSIEMRVPGYGQRIFPLLEKGTSVQYERVISEILNELNALSSELIFILDDFHLIELPAIHHSFIYLIDHLPPHIHIYIASRTDLMMPTARLLARGELFQINIQDLRFQLDEGLNFFHDTTDLLLSKEQVTELFKQTEGWVTGMQLAAISLKRSDNIAESIHRFSGQHHHISDYLLEEVLRHQSESLREFLLNTSILNRLNHSLCQAVTGQLNAQEQLEKLEQLNLFIIPLDDNRNWYRYHHLFSEFLRRVLWESDPGQWEQAHIRAAYWLENAGFDEEAVEHYLEGKQYTDVVRLIEKNLHTLMQSKSVTLNRWVSVLPDNSFAEKPMIEMFYISILLGVGEWEAAFRRVKQAELWFQALHDKLPGTEWNQVIGNIYFFCAVTSYLQKDLVQTSEYFELVERYMPEGSLFQTMGRNRFQGYDSFDDHLAFIDDLHAADTFLVKWIKVWKKKKVYPFIGYLYASYSKLLYEWNRLDEAEFYVNQALGRKDIEPFARIVIHNTISAARIKQAKGDPDGALALLTKVKSQIDSPDYELFMVKIEAEEAIHSLQQGSSEYALDWMGRYEMAHTNEVSMVRVAEHLALARVLGECGRTEEALDLLERLHLLLMKEDRLRDRIKVLILQSMTLQRVSQTEHALVALEGALHLGEPEGYIRSFIDEGPMMGVLLSIYLKDQQTNSRLRNPLQVSLTYVKQLLQVMNITPEDELSLKEILTEQETKIIRLIGNGLSNKEVAYDLSIKGETVKSHIKNVYRKLRVSNRVQALQRAKELNILD
ncbi:LuxR C-terminal-related transcriptional regulator [Paenibacillus antarcticus]|uniref:HTH luxR-type domain-containing protein n=1 Tax=Paenibacillus antarcticus TaxID=253703 RepID=A0A168QJG7_9BACL|nr:LuxR C-terminal-related transcriptional regulator [Paenibacillus antarcticus]OAB47853.1 hypothetical protein PBAT_02960 [Paenibacillus antarcticus]